jgi:hypothetical protein
MREEKNIPMAQKTSFDFSWALFFICLAPPLCFPLIPLLFCLPIALLFCLAWWRHCCCLTILGTCSHPMSSGSWQWFWGGGGCVSHCCGFGQCHYKLDKNIKNLPLK